VGKRRPGYRFNARRAIYAKPMWLRKRMPMARNVITDMQIVPARRIETMTRFLLLTLALMCENVNAAPQAEISAVSDTLRSGTAPAGAAPFTLAHPLCQTGFTIAQRYDERNAAGTIIKSIWVRKCTKGRIVYGRKV
jgi:hypothetical protein